ncbi:MAG: hypothetical protein KC561_00570 [Myxococcales bacterium]|nr:hypothetical protein [Myxococcales bacterium]
MLLFTGLAATISILFASANKPHVFLQTTMAYGLVWCLLFIYRRAYTSGRLFLQAQVWLVVTVMLSFLAFIHLDDAPARVLLSDSGERTRAEATSLYWAVVFDVASATILTIHFLVLRGLLRRMQKRIDTALAKEGGSPNGTEGPSGQTQAET